MPQTRGINNRDVEINNRGNQKKILLYFKIQFLS
jgi:hypothetical protein